MPFPHVRHILRAGLHTLIILFVLWHSTAIAIYAIPSIASDPLSTLLRIHVAPIVRPYILWTSQWQQWNLFAPDPLRRVTHYHLQTFDSAQNIWVDRVTFQPGIFLWWKHAARFKILDRIFDLEEGNRKIPIQKHFLAKMCREFTLPPTTKIRMLLRYYVIPNIPELTSFSWWKMWQPTWYTIEGPQTTCL